MRIIYILTAVIVFTACGGKTDSPELIATIHPYGLLLKELAGNRMRTGSLIPPGASPHTYSPIPADLRKLQRAKLIVANGLGLEGAVSRKLYSMKKSMGNRLIVAGSVLLGKHGGHSHHHDHRQNPHLWMSRKHLAAAAALIVARLEKIDPAGREVYRNNLGKFLAAMDRVDSLIRKERKLFKNPGIVTFHDAFFYFRKEYGIKLVAVVASSPGRQPSSKELAAIGRKIRENPVKTIFIEPQLNPKAARVIAGEYGLTVSKLDPLGSTTGVGTMAQHFLKSWNIMKKSFRK